MRCNALTIFMNKQLLWERFQNFYTSYPEIGLSMDISRMGFSPDFFQSKKAIIDKAFADMKALESGAIANPDEKRMVGHYWLRTASMAPTPELTAEITETLDKILEFAEDVHTGEIEGAHGIFQNVLLIGIGGSALGPQFVSRALGHPGSDLMKVYFFDNTDPDGMDTVLASLMPELGQTLCIVISKSGGTKETRNGMLEAKAAYEKLGLCFEDHAVAVTMKGSALDKIAEDWVERFPMWDWVGGRTSETSAVGLLAAALQGIDIEELLRGASECDTITRQDNLENPAMRLALMWLYAGNGRGEKDMVILPYKDRLELLSKYLQQLIMESLGKEKDLLGNVVHQGIAVYGNKGSTDQHAFVQQLREGVHNFFVTFIQVLKDRNTVSIPVEPNTCSGDYLMGFLLGTRQALFENGRESVTLSIREISPFTIGVLIALFERAVGFYASLIGINAYHQPGVEAGKKAATSILKLQGKIQSFLITNKVGKVDATQAKTVTEIAEAIGETENIETIFFICEHLAANADRYVVKFTGATPAENKYQMAY